MPTESQRATRNRLAGETSPYLLQHADNPVDWFPWGRRRSSARGPRASPCCSRSATRPATGATSWPTSRSRRGDGRAHERVVREREGGPRGAPRPRPHLPDRHQMLTQRGGGWPLTMFLSPQDHRPFFGGTYFPPEPKYGMPPSARCSRAWRSTTASTARTSDARATRWSRCSGSCCPRRRCSHGAVARAARRGARHAAARLRRALRRLRRRAQVPAPHEPRVPAAHLARVGRRRPAGPAGPVHGDAHAHAHGEAASTTSSAAVSAAIRGRVLDDPALREDAVRQRQLLAVSAQAAVATADPLFRRVTAETADWIRRDMEHPDGGYYATLDADSEGTRASSTSGRRTRPRALLDEREYAVLARRFGLDRDANFEGRWHLHAFEPLAEIAAQAGLDEAAAKPRSIRPARSSSRCATAASARPRREDPHRLERPRDRGLAPRAARSTAPTASSPPHGLGVPARTLLVRQPAAGGAQGRPLALPAYLDDHAFLGWALLELLQARWHGPCSRGRRARRGDARAFRGPRGRRLLLHAET